SAPAARRDAQDCGCSNATHDIEHGLVPLVQARRKGPLLSPAEPIVSEMAEEGRGSFRPDFANRCERNNPRRASRNSSAVPRTPNPYFTLRRKSIDEASSK